ncbi:MAG: 2-oxo-hepta-3-ene-1,7-dioic acid hydratase [Pseudomonadales bacterium]
MTNTPEPASMTAADIEAAATALYEAEQNRVQVRPTSALYPGMTLGDAYRVQNAVLERKLARGRRIVGRKIGLTSRAMQRAMHIDEPDFGTLLDDMVFANGDRIEAARFTDPRLEVELAFVLGEALSGEGLEIADVMRATREVVPALELIAARSFRVDPQTNRPRGLLDTVADNAASAGIVLGTPFAPADVDLRWCGAILKRNGEVEETGLAAGVLDHPANGVVWLARRFAAQGIALEAGQVILAGSFTRPVEVVAGDEFIADYGPLGHIACRFD